MLKAFSASAPAPIPPSSFPDNVTLRDGIIDGTYTISYYDETSDKWYYLTSGFEKHMSDDSPYWDFLWNPMDVSGSYCFTKRAVVKSTGSPDLGAEIFNDGKSNLHNGDLLYMGFWIKTS